MTLLPTLTELSVRPGNAIETAAHLCKEHNTLKQIAHHIVDYLRLRDFLGQKATQGIPRTRLRAGTFDQAACYTVRKPMGCQIKSLLRNSRYPLGKPNKHSFLAFDLFPEQRPPLTNWPAVILSSVPVLQRLIQQRGIRQLLFRPRNLNRYHSV